LKGTKYILYFYPRDNTPGCTTEACNFRDNIQKFVDTGIRVIGVSADSPSSHQKFIAKHNLNFTLLSDQEKVLIKALGVNKGPMTARVTFLVDEEGKIEKVYGKVSPSKHLTELVDYYGL
jgi:peroxiredoxin Q/BCP